MVRRRDMQSKTQSLTSRKASLRRMDTTDEALASSNAVLDRQHLSENLDDETRLAKRHLTKEMWQLVSIAVKRMADELVSISNNQQTTPAARTTNQETQMPSANNNHQITVADATNGSIQPLLPSITHHSMTANIGGGDVPVTKDNETVKRRTMPIQMLEPSVNVKKKVISNNATRRTTKPKTQNKLSKKSGKTPIKQLRNNLK